MDERKPYECRRSEGGGGMSTFQIINFCVIVATWGFIYYYNRKWKKHKSECEQLLDSVEITQKETHKIQMHKFGWRQNSTPEVGVHVLLLLSDGSVIMGYWAGPFQGYRAHQSFLFDDPENLLAHGWQPLPT